MISKPVKAAIAAAFVGIVGLGILAGWFGVFGGLIKPDPSFRVDNKPRIELTEPDSPVYLEKHTKGANGNIARTDIIYDNRDTGVKLYRENGKLAEWTVEYRMGGTKLHVFYAEDGLQVISGYELRTDRSMKWKATNTNGLVEVTTFYYDGATIFSVAHQKIGDVVVDTRYYRKDNTRWAHHAGSKYAPRDPSLDELFDINGNMVYSSRDEAGGKTTVTYYRPDGTIAYVQNWAMYSDANMSGEGGYYGGGEYSYSYQVLKSIDEYAADGKSIARTVQRTDDGTRVATITEFSADGTKTVSTLNSDQFVSTVEVFDKDGKVVSAKPRTGGAKVEVSSDLVKTLPVPVSPVDFWTDQEKNPEKRNLTGPGTPAAEPTPADDEDAAD
jgi:antitoxin component YwqK of YwqJK toxin-antitoxin module